VQLDKSRVEKEFTRFRWLAGTVYRMTSDQLQRSLFSGNDSNLNGFSDHLLSNCFRLEQFCSPTPRSVRGSVVLHFRPL